MTSNEIRSRFLKFFADRGHRVVPSSSLVPANDPTLLFANAGMNQFKDVFLGREKRDYARACSSQKCVRAGGKHNDLEQVGRTTRHHTFFEMLGNFSFGAVGVVGDQAPYFKRDAIAYAWELLTSPEWFAIPKDKLYITVFGGAEVLPGMELGADTEARNFWLAQNVLTDRILLIPGLEDNFWAMGDTGPCGPCSEIHYDMGAQASDLGHTDCKFPCDCGRYVEIWNLVFMQYNREVGSGEGFGTRVVSPLPQPSIDTGAGLERLAAALQGKTSNFDTDLFQPLIEEAASLANVEYGANHETDVSLRIIADHGRAATFLVSDGVLPSNEGRGYVLRLIIRRALYRGQTLGLNEPFLFKLSGRIVDMMKDAYPELAETAPHVAKAIKVEEERYAQTVKVALEHLDDMLIASEGRPPITFREFKRRCAILGGAAPAGIVIGGEQVFTLHDTFGLRPEFLQDVLKNYGVAVDLAGYQAEMQRQRERARASWKGAAQQSVSPVYRELPRTEFVGYDQLTADSNILAIFRNGASVPEINPREEGEVVLDVTPFYAEAGGQVGDVGAIKSRYGDSILADVLGCYQPIAGLSAHRIRARERIVVRDQVRAVVDAEVRANTMRNHTATHLLHAALRKTLGTHVKQAGSLVAPDRLRFDFTHYAALDEQDVLDIEDLVNDHILRNEGVRAEETDLDAAISSGAMALFGEKYGDRVRVVSITDFSKELCGGTHVSRTGDIGLFKIVSETSVAAGTRRIEALTGQGLVDYVRRASQSLTELSEALRAKPDELVEAVEKLAESEKKLRKQLEAQQLKRAAGQTGDLVAGAKEVKGVRVVSARVDALDRPALRQMVDGLRAKLGSGVIVLGSVSDSKVALVAAVTKDLTNRLDAGKIVKEAAAIVEGTGGGRKDLAEAGGKSPEKLDESLKAVPSIVGRML